MDQRTHWDCDYETWEFLEDLLDMALEEPCIDIDASTPMKNCFILLQCRIT